MQEESDWEVNVRVHGIVRGIGLAEGISCISVAPYLGRFRRGGNQKRLRVWSRIGMGAMVKPWHDDGEGCGRMRD